MVGKPFRDTTILGANHDSNAIRCAIPGTDSMVLEDVDGDEVVDSGAVEGLDEAVGWGVVEDLGEEAD
jgi:hypothetical protein